MVPTRDAGVIKKRNENSTQPTVGPENPIVPEAAERGTNTMKTLAVAAVLTAAGAAQASPIIQTQNFGPAAATFSDTLTFNQFNGNLADLISIEIIADLTVSGGSAALDNDGGTSASVDLEFGTTLNISSMDVSLVDGSLLPVVGGVAVLTNPSINLDANDGDDITQFDAGGPDWTEVLGLSGNSNDNGFISSSAFAGYVGAGTFDINIEAATEFSIIGGSAVQGSFTNQTAEGSVTVIYNFIPAPGAATLAGLAGIAAVRRRR